MVLKNGLHLEMRHAECADVPAILDIIGQAQRRMAGWGIDQWQDGYPNEESIKKDLDNGNGYVFTIGNRIAAYAALIIGDEPTYHQIDGKWLTDLPYIVVHRVAVHDDFVHQGIAHAILQFAENLAKQNGIRSFRIDTHCGNRFMTNLILHSGFTYCGVIKVRDGVRDAYEMAIGN